MCGASSSAAEAIHSWSAQLISLKEELGRERDRAVLPILRRTLEEQDAG
jgi:hypothetical protein